MQGMKLQDMKMTDQMTGHEIAGMKMTDVKLQDIAAFVLQCATFPHITSSRPQIFPYSHGSRWMAVDALRELEVEREQLGRMESLKLGYYGHNDTKIRTSMEKELIQGCTPGNRILVVDDSADVGRTTSSSGQG